MNIKYVEIFQVFGNIFSVYKKSENFKVLLVLYSVQCFSHKKRAWHSVPGSFGEPGTETKEPGRSLVWEPENELYLH